MSNDSDPSKQHFMECPYYQPETSPVSSPESTSPVSSPESIIILSNDAMHKQQRFEAQQVIQLHELPTTSIKRSSTSDTQRSNNNAPDIPSCDALSDRKRKHRNVEYALGLQPPTVIEPPLGARTPVVVSQQDRVGLQEKGPVYTVPQAKSTINFNIVEFNNDDFFTSSVKKPKNNTTKKKTPTQYNPDDIKKQQPLEAQQLIQLLQLPTVSIKRSPMSYAQRSYNNLHDTRSCDVLSNSKHDRKNVDRALRLQLPVVTEPTSGARPPVIVTLQDRVRTQDTDMIYGVPQSKSTITFQDPVRHQEQDPLYAFFQSDPTITSTTPDIDNEVLNWNEFEILLSNTTPEISAQSMLASKASKSVNRSKNRPRTKNPPIRYNTDGIHKQQRLEAQQVIQLLELPTTCIERSGESEDKLTDNNLSDTRSNDVLSDCKRKGRNFERVLGPQPPTIAEPSFDARTPVVISFQYPLGPEDTHAICEVPQSKSGITFTIPDFYNDCFNWAEIDDILSATIRGVSDHKQQLLEAQKVIQPPELPTISIERSYTTDNKRFDGDVPDTRSCDVLSDCTDERINLGSALGSQATRVVEPPLRTPTPVVISLQYPVRPEDIYPIYGVPQAESTISSTIFDFGNNDLNWDKIDHILPGTVPEVWAQSMLTSKVSKSVKKSGNSSVKKKARIQCNLGDIQKQQRLEAQEVTQPPELPTTSIERSSPSNNNKRADNNVPDTPSCAVLSHSDDERINIERALGPQALRVAEPLLETPTPVVVPLQYPVRSEDTYPIYRVPQPESTISFTTPGFGKNDFNWDEIDHILSTTIPEVWAQSVLTSEVSESVRKSNNTSMKEKPSSRYNPDDIHRQQRLVAREITEPPELPTISIGRSCTSDDKRTKHDGLDTRSCDVLLDCKDKRINDERALGAQPPAVTELSFGGCPLVAVSLQYPEGPECTYPLYRVPESKSEITFTIPDSGNDDVNCGKIHDMRSSTIPEVSADSILRSLLSKSRKESRKEKLPIRYNADDIHRQQRLVDQEIMQPPELPTTSIERSSASDGKRTKHDVLDTRSCDVLLDCKDKRINDERALGAQPPAVTELSFGGCPLVAVSLQYPEGPECTYPLYRVPESKSEITFTIPDSGNDDVNCGKIHDMRSSTIPEVSAESMLRSQLSKSGKESRKDKLPIRYNADDIHRQQRLVDQEIMQPPELPTTSIERASASSGKGTDNNVPDTRSYDVLSDCKDKRINAELALGPQVPPVTGSPFGARPPVVITLHDPVRTQDADAMYAVRQSKSTITFTMPDIDDENLNWDEVEDILSNAIPEISAQWMLTSKVSKSVKRSKNRLTKNKTPIGYNPGDINRQQRLEAQEVIQPPELLTICIERSFTSDNKRTEDDVRDTRSYNVLSDCEDERTNVDRAGPQPSAVTEPTSGARPPVVVTLQDRVRAQDTDAIYGVPQSKSTITFTISDFGNADLNSNESDIRSSTMPGVSAQSMLTSDVMKSVRKSNSTSIKEKSRIRCKRDEIQKPQRLEAEEVIEPPELPTSSIEILSVLDDKRTDNNVPDTPSCNVLSNCKDKRIDVELALGPQPPPVTESPFGACPPVFVSLQGPAGAEDRYPMFGVPQCKSTITFTMPDFDIDNLNWEEFDDNKRFDDDVPDTRSCDVRPEDIYPIYGVPQAESTISSTIFDFGNNDLNWDTIDHILSSTVPEVSAQSMLTSETSNSVKKLKKRPPKKKVRFRYNPPPLMSIDPSYVPPLFVQQQIRKQVEEYQKQKRVRHGVWL